MAKDDSKFYDGQIIEAFSIDHRYNKPNAFEIKFVVGIFDENRQPKAKVETFLEVSMEYGKGNNASKTQWDMTKETLAGFGFVGEDISNAQLATQLVNKPCRIREVLVDRDGKTLGTPRYYFTTAKPIHVIDDANARLKAIMSGVATFGGSASTPAGTAPGATAFAAPGANPFNVAPQAAAPGANPAPAASAPNPFANM